MKLQLKDNERIKFYLEDRYIGSTFVYEDTEVDISAYSFDFKVNINHSYFWPTSFEIFRKTEEYDNEEGYTTKEEQLLSFYMYKEQVQIKEFKEHIIDKRITFEDNDYEPNYTLADDRFNVMYKVNVNYEDDKDDKDDKE